MQCWAAKAKIECSFRQRSTKRIAKVKPPRVESILYAHSFCSGTISKLFVRTIACWVSYCVEGDLLLSFKLISRETKKISLVVIP